MTDEILKGMESSQRGIPLWRAAKNPGSTRCTNKARDSWIECGYFDAFK